MPYINVQVTRERVTAQQKPDIIAGVTRLLRDVPGIPRDCNGKLLSTRNDQGKNENQR